MLRKCFLGIFYTFCVFVPVTPNKMEITNQEEGETREGFKSYYFNVLNIKNQTYNCSIVVCDKKIMKITCDCMHHVWEISRKIKTGKICRHAKFCIENLKERKLIK